MYVGTDALLTVVGSAEWCYARGDDSVLQEASAHAGAVPAQPRLPYRSLCTASRLLARYRVVTVTGKRVLDPLAAAEPASTRLQRVTAP